MLLSNDTLVLAAVLLGVVAFVGTVIFILLDKRLNLADKLEKIADRLDKLSTDPRFIPTLEHKYDAARPITKEAVEKLERLLEFVDQLNLPVVDKLVKKVEVLVDEVSDGLPFNEKTPPSLG